MPGLLTRSDRWPIVLLVVLSLPILFYRLDGYSVVNGDEAIYHRAATTMVETGNWFRVEFVGQHRVYDTFMNAPIQYWARATLISIFGDNLWTMRILSALFGLLSVLATYTLVTYLFDRRAAVLAGVVQLTTVQFVYIHCARTGELEPAICFFLTLAVLFLVRAVDAGSSFVPHFVCVALLANLKLPLIIVPLIAALVLLASMREARSRLFGWFRTGAIVIPLGLVWHAAQFLHLGGEALQTMAREGAGDMAKERLRPDYLRNVAYYGRTVFFGAFPYSAIYPFAALAPLRAVGLRQRFGTRALVVVPLVLLLFFVVVPRHYTWYVIPIYPFASALVGIFLARVGRDSIGSWTAVALALPLAVLLWVRNDLSAFHPFALRGLALDALDAGMSLRTPFGAGPTVGIAVTTILLALGLHLGRAFFTRHAAAVAALFLAVVAGVAAHRTLYPLTMIPYTSEMARVRAEIDAARAAGLPLRKPIELQEKGWLKVRFYFGEDFEIRRTRLDDAYFQLFEKSPDAIVQPRNRRASPKR